MQTVRRSKHRGECGRAFHTVVSIHLVFAFCILNFALTGCAQPQATAPAGAIVVGVRTGPNNIDPRLGNDEASARVAQLMFNTLLDIGDDLRPQPMLAERLENPDPLTYLATLRRGVKFHDGHELTSKDVVFTYSQMLDPSFVSPFKGAFRAMKSVRALDDYHVEFTLKEPFTAFPNQLAGAPAIVPAGAGPDFADHPIGTGPYKFVRYAVDDQVVLAPFPDYFNGPPKNAGVVIRILPDDTMRGLELKKGSIDLVVNDLPPDIVHQFDGKDFHIEKSPGLDYSYLGINMRDPVLRDKRVRHAIGYAIDRRAIVEYLRRGLARPATGLIPPQAWAYEPDIFQFTYDPNRSRQLLDEAGYKDPDGDGPLPRLQLSLKVSNAEETRLQATVIQQQLREVGIDLDVRSYEFATMYADVLKGNFQMFSLQWVGAAMVDPDILRRVFHSTQTPPAGFNRGHYSNPDVDRLLDLASAATTEADQKKYYGEAQKIIAEDAPYISIWNRTNVAVAQRALTGLHLNAVGNFESLKDVIKIVWRAEDVVG
jgi:peptide/nickel transport system substrate-binding protein